MFRFGEVEISVVPELMLREPTSLYPDFAPEVAQAELSWLAPHFYDPASQTFASSIHTYVLRFPDRLVIVDTGGGNAKDRPASPRFHQLNEPYLERLALAGVTPEAVDLVVLTHLHVDHVGWNTKLSDGRWVPTFPKARYVFSAIERDARDPARGGASKPTAYQDIFRDSVQPVIDSGQAWIVEGTETLAPRLDLMPIPGHAPGQMAVRIRSQGQEALLIGDVMHQPLQVSAPHWNSRYCEDQETARATRLKLLDYAAETGCAIFAGHFAHPHGGHVRRDGEGYRFESLVA